MKRMAVVTGASAGFGVEFALQLDALAKAERIDEIWLVARRRERLETLAGRLANAKGVPVMADLSKPEGTELLSTLVAQALSGGAELAWFVNNAGFGTYGRFAETPLARVLEEIDLDVRALTELSWVAARAMKRGGRIVNVASLAAFQPLGDFAVYAAAKAYVHHFSLALAAELEESGIVVTSLCPGPASTEFALVASEGARAEVRHGKDAATVVRRCLADARRGRWTSVPYFSWKATAFLSRFLGKGLVARVSAKAMRRPVSRGD
ncbi:MAG TPA: SDR family NAD(P)-dependent oxidoreductase [Spirochaetales bacterium]|nr:SDR family NAD(P)-dependent oxidoreductase [Spirochaetales bacterium]